MNRVWYCLPFKCFFLKKKKSYFATRYFMFYLFVFLKNTLVLDKLLGDSRLLSKPWS